MMPPIAAIVPAIAKTATRIAVDADAGAPGRLGVAADGEDVAAEAGALGDVLHADHEGEQDQHRQRHAAVGVEDRDGHDHGGGDQRRSGRPGAASWPPARPGRHPPPMPDKSDGAVERRSRPAR